MGVYSASMNTGYNNDYFPYTLESAEIDETLYADDIYHAASKIILQTEQNYYMMMQAVGISELAEIEEGVVLEASGTGFFTAIKNFFKKLFSKVASLLKTFGMKLASMSKDAQSFCDKYRDDINNIKVPKDFDYEGYKFTHVDDAFKFEWPDGSNNSPATNIPDLIERIGKTSGGADETDPDVVKNKPEYKTASEHFKDTDKKSEWFESIRGKTIGKNKLDADDFEDEIFKYFHNNDTEPDTINNVDAKAYRDVICNSNSKKTIVNNNFDAFKAQYNTLMNTLEKMEKEYSNTTGVGSGGGNTNPIASLQLQLVRWWNEEMKFWYECNTTINQAQLNAIAERNQQYKKVIVKLLSKSRMNTKDVDESAGFGMSHYNPLENLQFI